jgi:hypothetical protein
VFPGAGKLALVVVAHAPCSRLERLALGARKCSECPGQRGRREFERRRFSDRQPVKAPRVVKEGLIAPRPDVVDDRLDCHRNRCVGLGLIGEERGECSRTPWLGA